jgi:hypothetical protein
MKDDMRKNVVRALLGGLVVTALVVACGSDSKGSATSNSPLSKCVGGSSTSDACQSCEQNKCSSELHKCYGSNFNGGACKALVECANNASDPCKAKCTPDSDCESCITGDLAPCMQMNCADECGLPSSSDAGGSSGPPFGKATCADLAPCCDMITVDSAKTGCVELVKQDNQTICASYYESLRAFCQ